MMKGWCGFAASGCGWIGEGCADSGAMEECFPHGVCFRVPLLTGLRLLLGGRSKALPWLPEPDEEVRLEAGDVLEQALEALGRSGRDAESLPPGLDAVLREYQKDGVRFLSGVTEAGFGACLADDMGLGKTLQVIAWLESLRLRGCWTGRRL